MVNQSSAKQEKILNGKILEENTVSKFFDISYSNFFLDLSSEAREIK